MLWRVDISVRPGFEDITSDTALQTLKARGMDISFLKVCKVYLLEGELNRGDVHRITAELLVDPVLHDFVIYPADAPPSYDGITVLIFKKPGVMDPVEESAKKAIADMGLRVTHVRAGLKYLLQGKVSPQLIYQSFLRTFAQEVVDEIIVGEKGFKSIALGSPYVFRLVRIPILGLQDDELLRLNAQQGLSLSLPELKVIQGHFQGLGRNPTDIELETIAQTWSEHCKHKTLRGRIDFGGEIIEDLLKSTIMQVTNKLDLPWCVSVFKDNAGIIEFDREYNLCFKVETHNHPSAIEPYGGANTGIGGVIRDCLGSGLGAKPIFNTDVFCVGYPDLKEDLLPPGVLHPKRILTGVVSGVRDYGNRMGIPTVNGAVFFDPRYIGNPLVYCGTGGLLPKARTLKGPKAQDMIVLVGGKTGRDGIHGATFSSAKLTPESEQVSMGAVQIGNAITEKKLADAILEARDQGLYHSITDCGGGGLSSAVGEMGAQLGVEVDLEKVPLKYEGLSYTEIWISEAQERMILAVPPGAWGPIKKIFDSHDVQITHIGNFTSDGVLHLRYQGNTVGKLSMEFLHHGLPSLTRRAHWTPPQYDEPALPEKEDYTEELIRILGSWNLCSKEWIIRQYDHEVQGTSVIKPMQGVRRDGPGDAAVLKPRFDSHRGVVVANGMNPCYGDLDPYAMAGSAIDEAIRNIVAVGGDPEYTALLDNFCWGNPEDPQVLGALVLAARACHDVALAYGTPFISGKDSLHNEFQVAGRTISVPYSLLISAVSVIKDVRNCVTMDLKGPGHLLYIVGLTRRELGGSSYYALHDCVGTNPPRVDTGLGRQIFSSMHDCISSRLVLACHDISEGGLAVAAAEMAFAGEVGLRIDLRGVPKEEGLKRDDQIMFSESNSRFLVEVSQTERHRFEQRMQGLPFACIGETTSEPLLEIYGNLGRCVKVSLRALKQSWQSPLPTYLS